MRLRHLRKGAPRWGASLIALSLLGCGEERPATASTAAQDESLPVVEPSTTREVEPSARGGSSRATRQGRSRPPRQRPSREDRARLAALLTRGRRAARAGDHAEALTRFEEALEIDPQHSGLLCEAGWSAFHARSARAREYLQEGVRLANQPARRAACLYNLGRWYERSAEEAPEAERPALRQAAEQFYGESLRLRPTNRETLSRYRQLTGRDDGRHTCPPAQRFADVAAVCEALLPVSYPTPADRAQRQACGADAADAGLTISVAGEGPGELITVADVSEVSGFWTTWYLALRSDEGVDVLGTLGNSWERGCSDGQVEVGARWVPRSGAAPVLVVDIHETGSYSCGPSPLDECMERAATEGLELSTCDDESDDNLQTTDERYQMICARSGARYRCSAPGSSRDGIDPAARPGPLPEGDALRARLVCPPAE